MAPSSSVGGSDAQHRGRETRGKKTVRRRKKRRRRDKQRKKREKTPRSSCLVRLVRNKTIPRILTLNGNGIKTYKLQTIEQKGFEPRKKKRTREKQALDSKTTKSRGYLTGGWDWFLPGSGVTWCPSTHWNLEERSSY